MARKHRFTCPTCGNSFKKAADLAVCDGVVTRANEDGEAMDAEGNLLRDLQEEEKPTIPALTGMNGEPVPLVRIEGPNGKKIAVFRPTLGVHSHAPVIMEKGTKK